MSEQTVNFTIGEEMGIRLMEIAQEHVQYTLNPEKGLKAITDSLIGCPREIALKILTGELVLPVDVESQQIICSDREEHHKNIFPEFNPVEWAKKEVDKINQYINKPKGEYYNYDLFDWIDEVKDKYSRSSTISFDITKSSLIKFAVEDDENEIIYDIINSDKYYDFVYPFIILGKFIIKSYKIVQVINTLKNWYPHKFENVQFDFLNLNLLKTEFDKTVREIDIVLPDEPVLDDLDNYINSTIEIGNILSKGIEPVNILDKYSAGWLAPNGDFYGLNGEMANMLHNQIADALYDAKIIPNDVDENMIDSWLEANGWVKIHGNWVLYDGYNLHKLNKPNIPLTDIQIKKIYEYGALCCNGILRVGYAQKRITAPRFQMTEPLMLGKLFEY